MAQESINSKEFENGPTVFVVDDNDDFRETLCQLFGSVSLRCNCYCSAEEFLDDYAGQEVGCLVLDVRMPGMSGIALQEHLVKIGSALPVVIMTGHGDISMAVEAIKNGAFEFLEKPFRDQQLLDSVKNAIDLSLQNHQKHIRQKKIKQLIATLTPREYEVMTEVVSGKTNKVIAKGLDLSPKTVDFHRCRVMEKMQVNSAVQLTGLVLSLDQPG